MANASRQGYVPQPNLLLIYVSRLALKIVVMARQEAKGKRQEGLGDFTFLYTVWFYCVHLLNLTH
ncbi:hypothetical protein FJR39_17060 [Dolichospermum flos-aquae UHCC 0037]|uniref:Uncharacterized protein n=1 Tax=Dolichospermum flos-aquae UHCC 0037 TaxID=2590026 RepID=A0ACC7S989_DOLFA|nr:hypothetical protein [Dolichospermum flos-aquae UHCC 0037]